MYTQPSNTDIQRSSRDRLSSGSYAEVDDEDDVFIEELVRDASDDSSDEYTSDSDDEFVPVETREEVDR